MSVISNFPSVGPYVGVTIDKQVTFKQGRKNRTFRVLVYGAYNAFGLIGSEKNGIAILDENERAVLADELGIESSGYFGPSKNQIDLFKAILGMSWADFQDLINNSGRNRYTI